MITGIRSRNPTILALHSWLMIVSVDRSVNGLAGSD